MGRRAPREKVGAAKGEGTPNDLQRLGKRNILLRVPASLTRASQLPVSPCLRFLEEHASALSLVRSARVVAWPQKSGVTTISFFAAAANSGLTSQPWKYGGLFG